MFMLFGIQVLSSALVLFATFYGYSLLNQRLLRPLDSLAGGFISFLATNYIISLPFTLLHLSYGSYFFVATLLNLPIFIIGVHKYSQKNLPNIRQQISQLGLAKILALVAVFSTIFSSLFFTNLGFDDAYYVSLIEQNKTSEKLYTIDPSTANPDLPGSNTHALQTWELTESFASSIFGLTSSETAHILMPLVVISIFFSLHRDVFFKILKNKTRTEFAIFALGIFVLMSGYSRNSQGTFLLSRAWTGKAIIAIIIIPLLIWLLYKIAQKKSPQKHYYFAIFVTILASVSLNPSAVFLSLSLVFCFGLILFYKNRSLKHIVYLASSSLPAFIVGIGAVGLKYLDSSRVKTLGLSDIKRPEYTDYLDSFLGNGKLLLISTIIGLLIIHITKRSHKFLTTISYTLPLLLFATILNPILFKPLSTYVTANTYWRLLWLIPVTLILPLVIIKLASFMSSKTKSKDSFTSYFVFLVLIVFVFGSYVYTPQRSLSALELSRGRDPVDTKQIVNYFQPKQNSKILIAHPVSVYFHNHTNKHTLLVSRELYLRNHYPRKSQTFNELRDLQRIVSESESKYTTKEFNELLTKYRVEYIVFAKDNQFILKYINDFNWPILHRTNEYNIVKI